MRDHPPVEVLELLALLLPSNILLLCLVPPLTRNPDPTSSQVLAVLATPNNQREPILIDDVRATSENTPFFLLLKELVVREGGVGVRLDAGERRAEGGVGGEVVGEPDGRRRI